MENIELQKKGKSKLKKVVKYIIAFVILFLVFNSLLLLGSLFPSSLIEKNVRESSETLLSEGNYYKISKFFGTENDNYTDAIMINEAYSIDNTNPFYSYMSARKNYKKDQTMQELPDTKGELISLNSEEDDYEPVLELSDFLDGDINTSITYARYWHGYLPFLRVLLIFFNILEIRHIIFVIFILIFVYFMFLLRKQFGNIIALIFGLSLVFEGYFFVSYSLECAPIFLVMMISSIVLLKRIDKIQNFYFYIFIVACITNFVDYLTVPLITLAIPLYIFILYKQQKKPEMDKKEYFKILIKSVIVWGIGYAITWLTKWIVYDVIYNQGLLKSAINQVAYRTQKSNVRTDKNVWQILIGFMINTLFNFLEIIIILYILSLIGFNKYKIKINSISNVFKRTGLPILIIAIMPFVWYIVLANHTVLHGIFVYRHMLIFLIGVLLFIKNIFCVEIR